MPTEKQATNYFNRLVNWRVNTNKNDPFDYYLNDEKYKEELIAQTLSRSVAPALPAEAFTEENFDKLHSFYCESDSPSSIEAFIFFAVSDQNFSDKVEKIIRRGLHEQKSNGVVWASFALLKWRKLDDSPATGRLISRFIHLIGLNQIDGMANLISVANQMYTKGFLSDADTESLIDVLPIIFDNSDYSNTPHTSHEAVSVSLRRAECAKLARNILGMTKTNKELLSIVEEARHDALPEVRFAVGA